MSTEEQLRLLVERCTILYQGVPIPGSLILDDYSKYLNSSYDNKTNIVLHSGSIFFDVLSVVYSILSPMINSMVSNDSIVESLKPGDLFIMFKSRRRFEGIEIVDGKKYITYTDEEAKNGNGESRGKIDYNIGKSQIRKYNGESQKLGGTGVRVKSTNRSDFLSWFLNVDKEDIPTSFDFSLIVLSDAKYFEDIIKNTTIKYKAGKIISLEDLELPISYYTSNGVEKQFGHNQTKSSSNIFYTERVSIIRDLLFMKQESRLLLLRGPMESEGTSELNDIIHFDSVNNILISSPLESPFSEFIVDSDLEAKFFACTKEYLKKYEIELANKTSDIPLYKSYYAQLRNAANSQTIKQFVPGGITNEIYLPLVRALKSIRTDTPEKESFRCSAFSLLNMFTSAFFTMDELESAISSEDIIIKAQAPSLKIEELETLSRQISDKNCGNIVEKLKKLYEHFLYNNEKKLVFGNLLNLYKDKKVLIVFPKQYYIDIFEHLYKPSNNIICTTIGRFTPGDIYDAIICVCGKDGKKFKPFNCASSEKTIVLLYESERKLFIIQQKQSYAFEKKIKAKISGERQSEIKKIENTIISNEEKEYLKETKSTEELLQSVSARNIIPRNYQYGNNAVGSNVIDVYSVGSFETGERILFTKYYKAVTYEQSTATVEEKTIDELSPGDSLIFFRKNDYTSNIVDFLFELLLDEGRFSSEVVNDYEKSKYWKELLSNYRRENHLYFTEIERRLQQAGLSITVTAVQQWLADDGRVIGPRDISVFDAIAKITGDDELKNNRDFYFQACRNTRKKRREILTLISRAINDKYRGNIPEDGSPLKIIYDNIEHLSEILELASITKLEKPIKINTNIVNRPLEEGE